MPSPTCTNPPKGTSLVTRPYTSSPTRWLLANSCHGSCCVAFSERLMRSRSWSTSSTLTLTSSPTDTTEPGWSTCFHDSSRHVDEAVHATEVDEGAEGHDRRHHAGADVARLEVGEEVLPLLLLRLLQVATAGQHDVVAVLVELDDLRLQDPAHVGLEVAHAAQLDERGGQEAAQADVHDEAALDDLDDRALDDALGLLDLLDRAPGPLVLGPLLREEEPALLVLLGEDQGLELLTHLHDVEGVDVVADRELSRGDDALGLVPDVQQDLVLVDLHHGAVDDLPVLDIDQRAGDGVLEALAQVVLDDLAGKVVALVVEGAERRVVGGGCGDVGQRNGFAFGGADSRWEAPTRVGRDGRPRLPPARPAPSARISQTSLVGRLRIFALTSAVALVAVPPRPASRPGGTTSPYHYVLPSRQVRRSATAASAATTTTRRRTSSPRRAAAPRWSHRSTAECSSCAPSTCTTPRPTTRPTAVGGTSASSATTACATTWPTSTASPPVSAVGQDVRAGQVVGLMGRSGNASACHLHFGVSTPCPGKEWAVRRGLVWPQPYLDSWRKGGTASPAAELAAWAKANPSACAAAMGDPHAARGLTAPLARRPAHPPLLVHRFGADSVDDARREVSRRHAA